MRKFNYFENYKVPRPAEGSKIEQLPKAQKAPKEDEEPWVKPLINALRDLFNQVFDLTPGEDLGAAAYYVYFIKKFPINYKNMKAEVKIAYKSFKDIHLRSGRDELLRCGLIAKTLPCEEEESRDIFDREAYLPVHPLAIYNLHYKDLEAQLGPEVVKTFKYKFNKLGEKYDKHFNCESLRKSCRKTYITKDGKSVSSSNITVYYSGMWVIYLLLGSMQGIDKPKAHMVLSGIRIFDEYIDFYSKLLDSDLNIELLLLRSDKDQIPKVKEIKSKYSAKFDARYANTESNMTNRMTILESAFALDGRKMLPLRRQEPSYSGTMYFDDACINMIRNIFQNTWKNGIKLDKVEDYLDRNP